MPILSIDVRGWVKPMYPHKQGEPVFIRYGLWDSRLRSYNHSTGKREDGISAYYGTIIDGAAALQNQTDVDERYLDELEGRIAFPVTGKLVGLGSDCEPVIQKIRLLALPLHENVKVRNIQKLYNRLHYGV